MGHFQRCPCGLHFLLLCSPAARGSFRTALCLLYLRARAPLPGLFSVLSETRGMYYLEVWCFTAGFSLQIRRGCFVLPGSSGLCSLGAWAASPRSCRALPGARQLALGAGSALTVEKRTASMGHATQRQRPGSPCLFGKDMPFLISLMRQLSRSWV